MINTLDRMIRSLITEAAINGHTPTASYVNLWAIELALNTQTSQGYDIDDINWDEAWHILDEIKQEFTENEQASQ